MLSTLKRVGIQNSTLLDNKKIKTSLSRGPGYSQQWKFWLLSNYEFCESAVAIADDIIEHSHVDKENLQWTCSLRRNALGSCISDIFGERVKHMKRGPRNNRRSAYLNLRCKPKQSLTVSGEASVLAEMAKGVELPEWWHLETDHEDQVTFFRREKLEFNGQRVTLELIVEMLKQQPTSPSYTLKSHNCQTNLTNILKLHPIDFLSSPLPIQEQISYVLRYLDGTNLCLGILLEDGEKITALIPHITGQMSDTTDPGKKSETRSFSSACQVVSNGTTLHCTSCGYLRSVDGRRKSRSEKRSSIDPRCNKRYLSREELMEQLKTETKLRKNAEMREAFWKKKFESEALEMDEEDQPDLIKIFESTSKDCVPPDMACLWEQQQGILSTSSKNGYRWHPNIIRLCIDLYCKNPHVLDPLRNFIKLPSNKTIRLYKNRVKQEVGWNREILEWCLSEARSRDLKPEDYCGGFVIDEMKIQENLEMVVKNGKHRLVGFVELGEAHDHIERLTGKNEPSLATHVLQFIFISDCGFRFPIAQFPSGQCSPTDLYLQFWKGVLKMREIGFSIYWCILDGADCNRQFIKLHFEDCDPATKGFVTRNPYTGEPMVFIMDCKHNLKKIRNNIEKSNKTKKPRCLVIEGKSITWEIFKNAFNWDQSSFSLPLHEKLTPLHFELDPAAKMRNHLAEDVLNKKMLFLMQNYQEHLSSSQNNDEQSPLDATIKLLGHTSQIIELFESKCPISNVNDKRLKDLKAFLDFMLAWKEECGDDNTKFISSKLWFDIQSMCLGFQSLVNIKLNKFPQSCIKPAIVNQDCVENHFCQVRACNGQNTNPTYHQQESTQNSIRFGQTVISKKSNARNTSDNQLSSCSLFAPKTGISKHSS